MSKGTRPISKSAVTGKIVSPKYAATHPRTTYTTQVPKGK